MSTSRPKSRAQAKAAQASKEQARVATGRSVGKRLGIAALAAVCSAPSPSSSPTRRSTSRSRTTLPTPQASIIYYADGKTEMDRISEVNRESVPLTQVPKAVQEAHLAAEDRNFYQNSGICPTGIARAVWVGAARRRDPGRVDDHPAVRQELLPDPGPDAVAQGEGDHHLDQDRQAEVQGPDPRELPQHDLLRPRRLRHPDGVQGLLQQGRLQAHRLRGRPARLGHPRARRSTTPAWAPSRRPTPRSAGPTSSTAW